MTNNPVVPLLVPDKQKENEVLREALARRTARLEQSRAELEALRQEREENQTLTEALQHSRDKLYRYWTVAHTS